MVQIAEAVPDVIPGFQAIASLEGSSSAEVHTRVAGFLIRQNYREGASVRPGELLFEMDARPFQEALDQAKANLADKQAQAAPRSEIDAAQAAVTAAQLNLGETKIVAPVGGIAGASMPGPGDWIEPGKPLASIATADPIKAVFTLPKKFYLDNANRIAKVLALPPEARPETLALVLADGTRYPRQGRWDSIEIGAPDSNQPVTVYALFPNPDLVLRPGQFVKVNEAGP